MPAYPVKEYRQLPKPDKTWVWRGILPVGGSALLFGDPKLGKSFLALGLCEAVADLTTESYLGLGVDTHGPALYIQMDTPRALWMENYLSTIKSPRAEENLWVLDKECDDRPNPFDVRTKEAQLYIQKEVDRIQPAVSILDTMRRMHGADENDPTTASHIYEVLYEITAPFSRILITHKKKQQHGDNSLGTARGSTAFAGAVDAILNMTKDALHIEARSDVVDEIPIFQGTDGRWKLNSREDEIQDFLQSLDYGKLSKEEVNQKVMAEFGVSRATAKRWRAAAETGRNG